MRPRSIAAAFAAGLLFGLGLLLSGMADPAKVLGFLDLGGAWDPSLALVMAGAIGAGLPGFALARRRRRSLLGEPMELPERRAQAIDRRLLAGAALFGVGWGLAGICPGPGLVLVGLGRVEGLVFVAAMAAGMKLFSWTTQRPKRQP